MPDGLGTVWITRNSHKLPTRSTATTTRKWPRFGLT